MALHNRGHRINYKTVQKLMSQLSLKSLVRPKKYCSYNGLMGSVVPNIINRDFYTNQPNQKWTTDITMFSM